MALHCMYPSVLPTKFSSKKRTSEYIYMSCKLYCVSWLVKDNVGQLIEWSVGQLVKKDVSQTAYAR